MKQQYDRQEEVYFIGGDLSKRKGRRRILLFILICLCIATGVAIIHKGFSRKETPVFRTDSPGQVDVMSRDSKAPLFNGRYGMAAFPEWLGMQLTYPEGLETMDARVVIAFDVRTDGTIGGFEVISAPRERAFQEEVLRVLRRSPRWTPARLANGEAVEVRYTLPVQFSKIRK